MTDFKIIYEDPETLGMKEVVESFSDYFADIKFNDSFKKTLKPTITALEWAEDYAYAISDKGYYRIETID